MEEPKIADIKSIVVDLKPGTYHWCTCGHSKKQPFCDASHKSTQFKPNAFTIVEQKTVHLCMCKHTKNPPYCDGTHKTLNA